MKLFSEKVSPTLTNSSLSILQVKDYEEIFFGVYEIEINKNKYPVEKISEHNGNPVVSVPVTLRGEKKMFPFVLSKGKFEILFNENNTLDSDDTFVSTPLITESVVSDPIDIFVEDVETLSKVDNNKKKILSQIKRAKREASEYASKIKKQKIDEANVVIDSKKKALDKMIEEARSSLVDEFISISNKIKVEFIDENDNRFGEIKETIDNKIIDLSNSLSEGLKGEFKNSEIQFESKIKELVSEIHLSIQPKIDKKIDIISNKLDKKVESISIKLDEKVNVIEKNIEHVEKNLDSKFTSKVDSIIESTVELNAKINKGVNKALSRVGNVDKHIEELSEDFNSKINDAEKNILEYYTDKIELLEKNAFDFNENTRKFFVESIEESRNNLIQEIRKLKDSKPIEYIIESKDENIKIKSDDLLKDLDKKINKKIDDEVTRLRKYISVYGGGGGTVAMQFADGGTMNGNLNINGDLFVSGATRINELSTNRIYTTHLEALSANITVIDIKQYELSGFNVTGDVTIQGSISASQYLGLAEVATSGDYNDLFNLPNLDTGAYLPLSGGTMDDNALIKFDNDARLQEGTTSAGANGGIALKCSIDYELKWEAGRLYVMEQDGFTIRVEQYGFTIAPTATDDATKGYIVGSRRILDNGSAFTCTDAATGVAVWRREYGGNTSVTTWHYRAKTTITTGNPTDAHVIWNNATQINATSINVSHKDQDNDDIEFFLGFIQEGQQLFLQDRDVSQNFQIWLVSGTPTLVNGGTATAYFTFPVTLVDSGGTGTTGFANNHQLLFGTTQTLALHAPTHAIGGSDPLTPADIGAVGLTGNQTISGIKTFNDNVIIIGDAYSKGNKLAAETFAIAMAIAVG